MNNDAAENAPDGLVLLPKAGGWSSARMIEQQNLVNRRQATAHAAAQVQNLTFATGVDRLSDTMRGLMDDWNAGKRSLSQLFLTDNRLQGVGLLLVVAGLAGLVIDSVLAPDDFLAH